MKKAVILAAGKGTRMISITNGMSKEMLILNNKPILEYSINEAFTAGCTDLCIVINEEKKDILNYIEKRKKEGANIKIILREPNGIMDAIYATKDFVGNNSFCLILPDMISLKKQSIIKDLIAPYEKYKKSIIGIIKPEENFGEGYYADVEKINENLFSVKNITLQKTDYRFFGRYVFSPDIFGLIEKNIYNKSESILLDYLIKKDRLNAYLIKDEVFDTGIPEGYLKALNKSLI